MSAGISSALAAAVLFGLSAPVSKLLLPATGPLLLAALLYLDEHHQHEHPEPVLEPHAHLHRHPPAEHAHPHVSDVHHRHRH